MELGGKVAATLRAQGKRSAAPIRKRSYGTAEQVAERRWEGRAKARPYTVLAAA
jgi:hypothetical protein